MKSDEDKTPRDDELSALYREAARGEPPPEIDAAILRAAREEARSARRASTWWRGWLAPVTAFATIVLAVALTLSVQRQTEVTESAPVLHSPAPQSGPLEKEREADAAPEEAARRGPGRAPAVPQLRAPAPQAEPRDATAPQAFPPPPAKQARPPEVPGAARQSPPAQAPQPRVVAPEAFPWSPAPRAGDRPARALSGDAPAAAPAQKPSASHLRERAPESQPSPAPPAAPADSAAPSAPSATASDMERRYSAADSGAQGAAAAPLSPEQWLAEIRRLKRLGRSEEAREALKEFVRAYPQLPLPSDLRGD